MRVSKIISDKTSSYKTYFDYTLKGDLIIIEKRTGSNVYEIEYYYDSYGNIIKMVDTSELDIGNINPFRYRSYYYDKETGWYYLNSRYYNPLLCRFITMDSVEYLGASGSMLSLNLYAYCENNPIMYVDPEGHSALRWPGEIHNLVVNHIVSNNSGFYSNVCMISNGKRLFCDLMMIDGKVAYIWEVKSCNVNFLLAVAQLQRYLNAEIYYRSKKIG